MSRPSNFDIKVAQQVLDEAIMNNKPHYLIKWKYLPHQFDTWEPLENLESIVQMVQKWIKTKRHLKSTTISNNVSSYCDTVNYINPMKKGRRKKRNFLKKKPISTQTSQVVLLDDDQDDCEKNYAKEEYDDDTNLNKEDPAQNENEENPLHGYEEPENQWNVKEKLQHHQRNSPQDPNLKRPLKFDPEEKQQNDGKKPESLNSGMKVVGRVGPQDIENIIEHFEFKNILCFKLELKDGRITNMREEDLKKICPQMLMEYYEDNDIKI